MSGPDKEFVWNSLITLLDHEWTKRLKEDKSLTDKDLEEIFQRMNIILLDRFPLVVRRMDYERLKRGNNELPSTFMERVFASSQQAQLDNAPPVARMLVKIITLLGTDNLNKSVKDHLIKVMRGNPNIDKKDEVMTYIYALESEECARTAAKKREEVLQVDELIECKVCNKKHKKRNCSNKCKLCGMLGSHKASKCFTAFPRIKQGRGDKRGRDGGHHSRSRSHSRGRQTPRHGKSRRDDKEIPPDTWRVGEREKSENCRRENDYPSDRDREERRQSR